MRSIAKQLGCSRNTVRQYLQEAGAKRYRPRGPRACKRDSFIAPVAEMGYSRATFVKFTTNDDTATLCNGLREVFDYFGGVPGHVLFDNQVDRDRP